MANFDPAVQQTLENEGGFFHNPVTGEVVNHGITLTFVRGSGYNPVADEAFIQNLSVEEAQRIYETYFWNPYKLEQINDQNVASKAFDLAVNMGPVALTLLQHAVNDCGGSCTVDGEIGPETITHVNALDPVQLLAAFRARAKARYQAIAAGNAAVANDLSGWLARLAKPEG